MREVLETAGPLNGAVWGSSGCVYADGDCGAVDRAVAQLDLSGLHLLIIENVGNLRRVAPEAKVFELSTWSGQGMQDWREYLRQEQKWRQDRNFSGEQRGEGANPTPLGWGVGNG